MTNPDQMPREYSAIARYLRWTGVLILGVAIIDFMAQGLDDWAPAYRYWIMPGFSVLLALCGLLCGYRWKETLGARLFFGLATVFMPVQISQIGAMLHTHFQGVPLHYSGWWTYEDISLRLIGVNLIFTALVTVPIAYTGFSILARRQVKRLMSAFILGCACLLIPVRETSFISLLLAGLFFILIGLDRRYLRADEVMNLPEGIAARLILWVPFLVILGRSFFYPWSAVATSILLGLASVLLLCDLKRWLRSSFGSRLCELGGTLCAIASWLFLTGGVYERVHVEDSAKMLLSTLPVAGGLLVLSTRIDHYRTSYRLLGALIASGVTLMYLLDEQTALASFVCLLTGIGLNLAGLRFKEKIPFALGLISLLGGISYYLRYLTDIYQASPWLCLSLLGIGILLLASSIEKKEKRLWLKSQRYLSELRSWH